MTRPGMMFGALVVAQFVAGPMSAQNEPPVEPQRYHVVTVPDPPGTITADLLRYPINEKARSMLRKALETINSGDHESAIKQLLDALAKYPESAAYVHSLIGIEYLRTNQIKAAVDSLDQAVVLLPHDAFNHYNLGVSLVCIGDFDRGEQEVRRANELNPGNPTMRALLDALILRKSAQNARVK